MAEICRPTDEFVLEVDGKEDNDIVQMRYCAINLVDIVRDENVAFSNGACPSVEKFYARFSVTVMIALISSSRKTHVL